MLKLGGDWLFFGGAFYVACAQVGELIVVVRPAPTRSAFRSTCWQHPRSSSSAPSARTIRLSMSLLSRRRRREREREQKTLRLLPRLNLSLDPAKELLPETCDGDERRRGQMLAVQDVQKTRSRLLALDDPLPNEARQSRAGERRGSRTDGVTVCLFSEHLIVFSEHSACPTPPPPQVHPFSVFAPPPGARRSCRADRGRRATANRPADDSSGRRSSCSRVGPAEAPPGTG